MWDGGDLQCYLREEAQTEVLCPHSQEILGKLRALAYWKSRSHPLKALSKVPKILKFMSKRTKIRNLVLIQFILLFQIKNSGLKSR